MAELRTEIGELAKRVEAVHMQQQREFQALKQIHEALKVRMEEENAGESDTDRLAALEPKIAALEVEAPQSKGKAPAPAHAKVEHK